MDMAIAGAVWWHLLLGIFAAALLVNGIPHFVQGVSGKPFPTPFSGGRGTLDSSVRNVMWGSANFLVGGLLLLAISGSFGSSLLWIVMAVAAFGFALLLAAAFSQPAGKR